MKAIVWTRYGPPDVLELQELEKPVHKDNEILIKVNATTVTLGDCELRAMNFPVLFFRIMLRLYAGITKPKRIKILGQEFSGVVEEVGQSVKRFKKGDEVFGPADLGIGAYAEYRLAPEEEALARKPANVSFEDAATLATGGINALHFLRLANIQPGQKVLINGAGGSIGTYGVQLAKHYGAEVTAVDRGEKAEMLLSIGADHFIDYTQEDFTRNGQAYDVIFDIVGKSHYSRSVKALNENGVYLLGNPKVSHMLSAGWTSRISSKKVIFQFAGTSVEDLNTLGEFLEEGILKAVIDKRYPLEETAEAHAYVETGQKKGNVVITVA